MVDLQETPATPPEDYGGDARVGWLIAGALLIAGGWGVGVIVNVVAHLLAPASGLTLWWMHVYPSWGAYSYAVLGIGAFAGIFGVVLLLLGRASPRGPLVLPGYDYSGEPRP